MSAAHHKFAELTTRYADRVDDIVGGRAAAPSLRECGIDDAAWPLVLADANHRPGELRELVECISGLRARGPHAVVIDVRKRAPLTAPERHRIAAAVAVASQRSPGMLRAVAWVVSTDLQARALLPLAWLAKAHHARETFTKHEDAVTWCCSHLADCGAVPTR